MWIALFMGAFMGLFIIWEHIRLVQSIYGCGTSFGLVQEVAIEDLLKTKWSNSLYFVYG